jgi:hypothetical protein
MKCYADIGLQIDAASSVDQSTGTVAGPKLEPRYLPLYQAMRKCITDEGYSPGHIVEDTLMKDVLIYHKLGVDSFREYLQQARITRAPIDFPSDQDYIEKIWFCPTERMVSGVQIFSIPEVYTDVSSLAG